MLGQALNVHCGCWNFSSIHPLCLEWSEFHKQAQTLAGSWAGCKHLYPQLTLSFCLSHSSCCCEWWDLLLEIGRETNFNLLLNFSSLSILDHLIYFLFHTSDEAQWLFKFSSQGRKWERTVHPRGAKGSLSLEQAQCKFTLFGEENPKRSA